MEIINLKIEKYTKNGTWNEIYITANTHKCN